MTDPLAKNPCNRHRTMFIAENENAVNDAKHRAEPAIRAARQHQARNSLPLWYVLRDTGMYT